MDERSGQLVGGPDEGNIITSTVAWVYTEVVTLYWLDGSDRQPTAKVVRGHYVWRPDAPAPVFDWERRP